MPRAASPRSKEQPAPAEGPPSPEPSEPTASSQPSQNGAAGSSPGSSAAADDPFLADRGQPFDPDAQPDEPIPPVGEPDPAELVLWTPERVRRLLILQGQLTHLVVGVAQTDWVWLDHELDMVCAPLAEYANRVPALQAMAHLSDEAAIAGGFFSYAVRSWRERLIELRRRAAQPDVPVTGHAPDHEPPSAAETINPEEAEWTL